MLEEWEQVTTTTDTFRLPVPGGWLYRYLGATMIFVPDATVWHSSSLAAETLMTAADDAGAGFPAN